MGQIKFMGSVILAVLFAIAIFNYAIDFGDDNDVNIDLSDDPQVTSAKSNLEDNVQTFKSETNSSLLALFDSSIDSGDETTRTGGQFKGGVLGAFDSLKEILNVVYKKIFGSEQGNSGFGIVLTALISFFGFVLGMYIWKTWAGKNPD